MRLWFLRDPLEHAVDRLLRPLAGLGCFLCLACAASLVHIQSVKTFPVAQSNYVVASVAARGTEVDNGAIDTFALFKHDFNFLSLRCLDNLPLNRSLVG